MERTLMGAGLLAAMLAAAPASAAEVWVNGQRLSGDEIAWLAELSCGPVASGAYWLDPGAGEWGYWGSRRVQGHIRDRCGQHRVFQDGNMSREGRLYYPGELLR